MQVHLVCPSSVTGSIVVLACLFLEGKVHPYLYLLKKQDNLKSIPRLSLLQDILLELISNVDSKLQTSSLECLIKTNYASGLLHKYRKLLEGFADDEKFKDMI